MSKHLPTKPTPRMRRVLVHAFPARAPEAVVLLDVERHETRTFLGDEIGEAVARLQEYDIINDYLFNELGYKTISHADDPKDLFLHSVMNRRQGYCLSLSILYLSLA